MFEKKEDNNGVHELMTIAKTMRPRKRTLYAYQTKLNIRILYKLIYIYYMREVGHNSPNKNAQRFSKKSALQARRAQQRLTRPRRSAAAHPLILTHEHSLIFFHTFIGYIHMNMYIVSDRVVKRPRLPTYT